MEPLAKELLGDDTFAFFPTAVVTDIAVLTLSKSPKAGQLCSYCVVPVFGQTGRTVDDSCSSDFFATTDASLQPRPVASRQYYTLPNSGAGVERRTSAPPVSISVESPRFHPHAKGKNIRLDGQLRRATRKNSFCNGITFSHRPVHLYEKVGIHPFIVFLKSRHSNEIFYCFNINVIHSGAASPDRRAHRLEWSFTLRFHQSGPQ